MQPLSLQFASLYRVTSVRNLTISEVLGGSYPSSWNLSFRRNLTDKEIELLERLMFSLNVVRLSSSIMDSRGKCLSPTSSFSVKSFFMALSKSSNLIPFLPVNSIWKSKAPPKVKALAWLVVLKKVNTNDVLQARRPYKSLSPHWCILCKGSRESVDYLFLHCPITLGQWHKLFIATNLECVPPRSIGDIFIISFEGLGNQSKARRFFGILHVLLSYG